MDVSFFFNYQTEYDEKFRNTFNGLKNSQLRDINFDGFKYVLQLNPMRIKSSTADITKPLDSSKCFLCKENMPQTQLGLDLNTKFTLFVNPFPIFQRHFTIVSRQHVNQTIIGNTMIMLELAKVLENLVVFYNSPKAGASAPFHCHFQAGGEEEMPLFYQIENLKKLYTEKSENGIFKINDGTRRFLVVETKDIFKADEILRKILDGVNEIYSTQEPEANIGIIFKNGFFRVIVLPREKHRPKEYSLEGDNRILVSPGFADMAGIVPCSLPSDYQKITKENIQSIMSQVSIEEEKFSRL